MEFSKQEYRSGLLFPSPGDLPNPGIKPRSSALQATSLPYEPWGRRENSSIAFWSHQSRSVDIDSNPLPDLHKFLFQMETGRRVHFFFSCEILHGMSTDSLNIVHWFMEKWKEHLSFLEIFSLQHGSYKSFLSCTMKEPLAISLLLYSLSVFWNFSWLYICWTEKIDKILYLLLLVTVLVLWGLKQLWLSQYLCTKIIHDY